jgi:hypothetical protein
MIEPTIGRIVWYHPTVDQLDKLKGEPTGQPHAAWVTFVWGPRLVNLLVATPNGQSYGVTSVTLFQEDGDVRPHNRFCEWMPYQKSQAAKYEASEHQKR